MAYHPSCSVRCSLIHAASRSSACILLPSCPLLSSLFFAHHQLLADDSDYPDVTTADAGLFATANSFAAMTLNRGKVKNFVLGPGRCTRAGRTATWER